MGTGNGKRPDYAAIRDTLQAALDPLIQIQAVHEEIEAAFTQMEVSIEAAFPTNVEAAIASLRYLLRAAERKVRLLEANRRAAPSPSENTNDVTAQAETS